ncbi:MAG: hypothetical protein HF308_20220, partial [Ignavibacteria bacterium]|nr:hypothetical protein [Ignavibacteria bacterium]
IRAEDAKTAQSAETLKKSIETSQNGIVSSYGKTTDASGRSYASMLEDAEGTAEGVTGANDEIIASNGEVVNSIGEVQKAASAPIKFSLDQTDISGIASYDQTRATANNPLSGSLDQINEGIQLADGNTLKLNSSGEMVIRTFDGIEKSVEDVKTSTDESAKISQTYASSLDQISKGISLANGNMLTLNSSGNLVVRTADGIQTSLSKIQDTTAQSASQTETYATSIEKIRNGIALADGNMLKLSDSGKIVVKNAEGIEKSFSSIQSATAKNTEESKKYAASVELVKQGIALADGNMLKLNSSGQFVVETVYGIQKSFTEINSSTEKSNQQTKQYADSVEQLSKGIQLADGNILKLNESNEIVIQTADGIQRSYEDIKKAIDKGTDSSKNYASSISEISNGIQLADG